MTATDLLLSVVLLLAGLVVRLLIAYMLFPGSGFESDISTYAAWAAAMAEYGFAPELPAMRTVEVEQFCS